MVNGVQAFERRLRNRGLRVTAERKAIVEEIFRESTHFDAEQLLYRLREHNVRVSRATVYRTLSHLVESGLVHKHDLGDGPSLYEPGLGREHHDHMICVMCGEILEFVQPEIERLQADACRKHGFRPLDHTLQIQGVCAGCARQDREQGHSRPADSVEDRD